MTDIESELGSLELRGVSDMHDGSIGTLVPDWSADCSSSRNEE